MTALNLRVSGKVQGVFFRANTQEKAQQLGLTGWVRNAEDGSVEIHAEGSQEALTQLEQWCHHGPLDARVDYVESQEADEEQCISFDINY